MPGFYNKGDYEMAGFAVGVVERHRIIDGRAIAPGDLLIGLPSSGLHSNGYSLVRKIVFDERQMAPETQVEELGTTIGDELLKPTRIYVRPILRLLNAYRVKRIVKGLAHITGGGLTENVPRILPKGCAAAIDRTTWAVPPIFRLLQRWGGVDEDEMFRVFNMGLGMVIAVPPYYAHAVLRRLERLGEQPRLIGRVQRGPQEVVYV